MFAAAKIYKANFFVYTKGMFSNGKYEWLRIPYDKECNDSKDFICINHVGEHYEHVKRSIRPYTCPAGSHNDRYENPENNPVYEQLNKAEKQVGTKPNENPKQIVQNKLCKYHLHGICREKQLCDYVHPKLCRYHMKRICRKGKKCEYNHPILCIKFIQHGVKHINGCKEGTNCPNVHPIMCRYIHSKGGCKNGMRCKFRHPSKTDGTNEELTQKTKPNNVISNNPFLDVKEACQIFRQSLAVLRKELKMTERTVTMYSPK